ncbi:MAG: hypothetical protein ACOCQ2_02900 [Halanaerobiales bacterium]
MYSYFTSIQSNKNNYIVIQKRDLIQICADIVKLKLDYKESFKMIWGLKEKIKKIYSFKARVKKIKWEIEDDDLKAIFYFLYKIDYQDYNGQRHCYVLKDRVSRKIAKYEENRKTKIKLFNKNIEFIYQLLYERSIEIETYITMKLCVMEERIICLPVIDKEGS